LSSFREGFVQSIPVDRLRRKFVTQRSSIVWTMVCLLLALFLAVVIVETVYSVTHNDIFVCAAI
jgi:predicted PurR-regulated permease PerM